MIVIIKDIPYKYILKDSIIQLYLAILVLLILLILDNVTGFILALCLLILYFKIYNNELKSKKNNNKTNEVVQKEHKCTLDKAGKCSTEKYENDNRESIQENLGTLKRENINTTLIPYISEEHLLAAQNNIIDFNNYNNEILGIEKGLHNENVYGSQGFDNNNVHMKGYDNNVLGSLKYGLIE